MKAIENLGLAAAEAYLDISLSSNRRRNGPAKEKNEYQSYNIGITGNQFPLKQKQIKYNLP